MTASAPPPGAPLGAIGLAQAEARWAAWRAQIWTANARRRGQGLRARVTARLGPDSRVLRAVTSVVEPAVVAWRRRRPRPAVHVGEFPAGLAAAVEADERRAPGGGGPRVTEVVVGSGVVGDLNAALARVSGWVGLRGVGDVVFAGAFAALAATGHAAGAACVYADDVGPDGAMNWRTAALGPVGTVGANRVGSVAVVDATALREAGGLSGDCGELVVADAVTRIVEAGGTALHVPRVVARTAPRPPGAAADAARAALARRDWSGEVDGETETGAARWRPVPTATPRVALVVPTRDRVDLLSACLASVWRATDYPDYEVVVVDNGSVEPATERYLAGADCRVVRSPGPFNYAAVVNRGVRATDAPYVVTLNNDVTVNQRDWLTQMVGAAQLPGVGVVGVRLDEPDGRAQHEGIAIAPYPQHLRRDLNYVVPDAWLDSTREASAVTGACQLFARSLFDELGGLDESLAVVHNDVDFCLRAGRLGRSTLYLASVALTHAESSSRGSLVPTADVARFVARWDVFGTFTDPHVPERLRLVGDVVECVDGASVG